MFQRFLVLIILASMPVLVPADIVRVNIDIGADSRYFDVILYDGITPATVDNFLNYVDDGASNRRYDGTFIHRSIPGFIVQTGGYTYFDSAGAFVYDDISDTYPGGLQEIPADGAVVNEFGGSGLSNIRGTLAMAKVAASYTNADGFINTSCTAEEPPDCNLVDGTGPDSATSQWFINLDDNSANLDDQNGGFTVFGRVLDQGMDIVDTMAGVPVFDLDTTHPSFDDIPLADYVGSVSESNLVRISTIDTITRPVLEESSSELAFGIVASGGSSSVVLHLVNEGDADLVMDGSSISAPSAPFAIISDTCSNTSLQPVSVSPTAECTLTFEFSPMSVTDYGETIFVTPAAGSNPHSVALPIRLTGEGVPSMPVLSVLGGVAPVIFDDTALGDVSTIDLDIINRGGGVLDLGAFSINGADGTMFSHDDGCDQNTTLTIGQTCTLQLSFSPDREGAAVAQLSIESNAGTLQLDLAGNGQGPEAVLTRDNLSMSASLGSSSDSGFAVLNEGVSDLEITSISITGPDAVEFSQQNTCPVVANLPAEDLSPDGICTVIITFTPLTDGVKSAMIELTTNDDDHPLLTVTVTAAVGDPDIALPDTLNVGYGQLGGTPALNSLTVENTGSVGLEFSSIEIQGIDAASFEVGTDCPGLPISSVTSGKLAAGSNCLIGIRFTPVRPGEHVADLIVTSDDPDEPVVTVKLTATGDDDVDGIDASEEGAVPNGGDGNNDNLQDGEQNNVVSFVMRNGRYMTLVSPEDTVIARVEVSDVQDDTGIPAGVDLVSGEIRLVVQSTTGQLPLPTRVLVFLSTDVPVDSVFLYGLSPESVTPSWYEFDYGGDGSGVSFTGKAEVNVPGGDDPIVRKLYILNFIDSSRGDADMVQNGEVLVTMALSGSRGSSTGMLGPAALLLMLIGLRLRSVAGPGRVQAHPGPGTGLSRVCRCSRYVS